MRAKEILVKEGLGDVLDTVRGGLYRATGFGGAGGNVAATRTRFINDFITQYKLANRSANQGGIPFDTKTFVQSYLAKNKWTANPEQMEKLLSITDPKQLGNALYAVGMQQLRDKSGYIVDMPTGGVNSQNQGRGNTLGSTTQPQPQDQEDTTLDPAGLQILKQLKSLKGPKYEKDLQEIIKTALWNLYGTDKQDYTEFVKQIMSQKTKAEKPETNYNIPAYLRKNPNASVQTTPAPAKATTNDENPNIIKGYND